MKKTVLLLALLTVIGSWTSQASTEKELIYDNYIYEESVHTVLFYQDGVDDPSPIVSLNGNDRLLLRFDNLNQNTEFYQYTIVHCDASWNPTTGLMPNEYINGLTSENIENFWFSTNTYTKYIHYQATIPTDNMKPALSGNYLLKVYRNFDENDLVLTRRFMVIDPKVNITATVKPATLAKHRYVGQEIDFEVDHTDYAIPNPYRDIKAVVMQNFRWANAVTDLKPLFINGSKFIYNYEDENVFKGGNEFRFFDIRSLRFVSQNVKRKYLDTVYHAVLNPDETRASNQYFQYIDFNGKRAISNRDGLSVDVDGDYSWVEFYLLSTYSVREGDVYIFGEFSDWRLQDRYKMRYNRNKRRYEVTALLKQGFYNYCYAVKDETMDNKPNDILIEGSHFETENDYQILFYHRNQIFDYDELVGISRVNSGVLRR